NEDHPWTRGRLSRARTSRSPRGPSDQHQQELAVMERRRERHRREKAGWLRPAVLVADAGILSTASLVLGVAAANGSRSSVLIAGIAGLVAGAMSMAAGEYVSVHSQKDAEEADLALERIELRTDARG